MCTVASARKLATTLFIEELLALGVWCWPVRHVATTTRNSKDNHAFCGAGTRIVAGAVLAAYFIISAFLVSAFQSLFLLVLVVLLFEING